MRVSLPSEFRTEAAANLRLALPLVAAQLSFVSMGTVDTVMAGWLGARELAAVAVGANLWFMFFMLFMGIFMAVAPIVAHRSGAGRDVAGTGEIVRGTLVLAVLLGLLWWAALLALKDPLLDVLALEPVTRAFAGDYLVAVSWGAVPYCLFFTLRNAAEGLGITRTTLAAGLVGFTVNALGDYVLMYGKFGVPALGPGGCGLATALGGVAMTVTYAVLHARHRVLRELRLFRRGWPPWRRAAAEVLRIGGPISLILTAEAWLFLVGSLMMARFGGAVVAAHQIAFNFAALVYMVPLSIGLATTVRVGQAAGAGDTAAVRGRGRTGIVLGASFALVSASAMAGVPHAIVGAYTDAAEVVPLAVQFLSLAALFQIADCVQGTSNGALRGIKDTRGPMVITVAAYWGVGFPLAAGLAFGTSLGPAGVWYGFIGGLACAAAGLLARFLRRTRSAGSEDRP